MGRVYLGRWRETDVAIKVLNAGKDGPHDHVLPKALSADSASCVATASATRHSLEREVGPSSNTVTASPWMSCAFFNRFNVV
jgi:hypothetical protein